MSMTGRYIDELQAQAAGGDASVQEQLRSVGLWQSEEDRDAERERSEYWDARQESDDRRAEEFEPLGLEEFWHREDDDSPIDSLDDGEALASAGFGTDEDYGWCGDFGDDNF